jgi:subtilisin family serine protease
VVVAAAGNESIPLCSYPAAAKEAVCVAATDSRGLPTFYSNFPNSPDGNVSVRAPGGVGSLFCEDDEDVWSTIWPGSSDDCQGSGALTGYDTLAGTSMSAPYVSGVAALLAAKGLSAGQILECLKTTSSNQGAYDPVYGYGIVNADAATSTCSPQGTGSFVAGSSGQGGSPPPTTSGSSRSSSQTLIVRVKRTTARKLARTRKLQLTIINSKPLSVTLKPVLKRRGARSLTLARKIVALQQSGTHARTLKLTRRSVRSLLRSRRASLKVLYRSGSIAGAAKAF